MSTTAVAPERRNPPELLEGSETPLQVDSDDLVENVRLIWQNRNAVSRAAVLGALFSIGIVLLIPLRYEATVQLMPPDGQSGTGMAMLASLSSRNTGSGVGALGGLAGDLLGVKNTGALFVGVLSSRTVADRVITEFELNKAYGTSRIEDTRKALAAHTSVSEDRKSGILSITVTDRIPARAAAVAQAYVTELDRLIADVSTSSARRERVFLEDRLRQVKHDLDSAAQDFSEFASNNSAINIPEQGKAMLQAAAVLSGQLIAAQSELRGLEAIYTDSNVRVQAVRARVAELQAQLKKMGGDPTNADIAGESPYPSLRRLPALGVTYADLFRRTKIEETVYEVLTQQYELAKVQEAKEIPSVKVLDEALIPTKKSYPPRTLFVGIGTVAIITLAMSWIFVKRAWDQVDQLDPRKMFAQELRDTIAVYAQKVLSSVGLPVPSGQNSPELGPVVREKSGAD